MMEPTNAMIHASCATVSIRAGRGWRAGQATHNADGDCRQGEGVAEDIVKAEAVAGAVIHLLKTVGRLERGHLGAWMWRSRRMDGGAGAEGAKTRGKQGIAGRMRRWVGEEEVKRAALRRIANEGG